MKTAPKLDRLDFKILSHLQHSGRCSNVDLANEVGLSPSPCLTRVRRLEKHGFIVNYGAQLALAKLGSVIIVFAEVTLNEERKQDFDRFERETASIPGIMECYNVAGRYDYLFKVVSRSVSQYHELMERIIQMDIGVKRYRSYIVLRTSYVKHDYPLLELFGLEEASL